MRLQSRASGVRELSENLRFLRDTFKIFATFFRFYRKKLHLLKMIKAFVYLIFGESLAKYPGKLRSEHFSVLLVADPTRLVNFSS